MKKIVYQRQIPSKTTTLPNGETIVTREAYLQVEKLGFTDSNKEIQIAEALKYAYNGEYTIDDDGEPEPEPEPTQLDRVEAQAVYTAMMTDTLLESEA